MAQLRMLDQLNNPTNQDGEEGIGGLVGPNPANLVRIQGNGMPGGPDGPGPQSANSGQTPRERQPQNGQFNGQIGGGNATSAPAMPKAPTPKAGAVNPMQASGSLGGGAPPQLRTFAPMTPTGGQGGLMGSMGGLQGGGLGNAFDPTSNEKGQSILELLKMLGKG